MTELTHTDAAGRVRMVDVAEKPVTRRTAVAEGEIRMTRTAFEAIRAGDVKKGEALAVARIAAIGGAKATSHLIPLCHPVALDAIDVDIEPVERWPGYRLTVGVSAEGRTGVEMEALSGVSAGLLALYDMCKALDRGMTLGPVRLLEKRGGRSGDWRAGADDREDDDAPRAPRAEG
ncbi:MAG: cyclic pyranopterin monophosphate synthase MoaC [Gemmatimonadota bacterium]|nr:cyclic pyranopterin monophosphate synthase MoaC [Gemmatimonadota bacterium]